MKAKLLFLTFMTFCFGISLAQTGSVKGTITSSDDQAAEMIKVILKGKNVGTITDSKGTYLISNIDPGKYILMVSYLGSETMEREITIVANQTTIADFILSESIQKITEMNVSANGNHYQSNNPSESLRIKTPLLETPQNIQVVSKDALADQQIYDMLEGVQRNVSGAQRMEHWDNYARINMRGSTLTAFRNGMNVSISPWSPLTEDMAIVERIEFVKGPAGFMISSSEPGGFYNVVTKKPTGMNKGEVTFGLGSFETYRTTLDLDGKLSKNGKVLYRFNAMGSLKGSHRDFEYNNRYTLAPVVKYLIDEKSSVTFEYIHQFSQMNVIGSNYAFSNVGMGVLPRNFTTAEPNLDPTEIKDNSYTVTFDHQLAKNWSLTTQVAYLDHEQIGQSLWPWGFLYGNDSLLQRGISIWDAIGINKTGQIFVNGEFNTGSLRHRLVGGVDYSHKDYYADWFQGSTLGDSTFNIYDPQYGGISSEDLPRWDRSRDIRERGVRYNNSYSSLFFQDELAFLDNKIRLTLGGRYTANNYINPYAGSSKDGKFTPRAGLSYSYHSTGSVYILYDESFLANPGTDWQGNNFDPISGVNMEFGVKKDWFNKKWNTTFAVYQITKQNILTADLEHPEPETGQFIYSKQTGEQQVQGIEFDLKGEIVNGLNLIVNYAYTDAKVTADSDPEIVGNRVPGATKHIQNTWLSYTVPTTAVKGLNLSVGYQYQGDRSSWFVFDGSENPLPDYIRMDASIGYRFDKLSINVMVNNLLDEYLYSGAYYYGNYYWQTEAGRNYRIGLSYKF